MIKKTISAMLAMLMALSLLSYAVVAKSDKSDSEIDDEDYMGFSDYGGYTETTNEYFFDTPHAIVVDNKEVYEDPEYEEVYAGSDIYIPIYVYPDGDSTPVLATDKMIKNDNVTISAKVMQGSKYVGEITMVNPKKLKLKDVTAGMYAHIPLTKDYTSQGKSTVKIRLVLSVNNVTYQFTQIDFRFNLVNRLTRIKRNSVYGAKTPTMFETPYYSGEVTFDFGDNIQYTGNVRQGKFYYMNLSKKPDDNLVKMYKDAHLEFYDFIGDKKTFSSTGRLEIPIKRSSFTDKKTKEAALYVYKVEGGRLTALGTGSVTFNVDNDMLTIYTSKLDSYVLSSHALMHGIEQDSHANILRSGYASAQSAAN